jgi:hypothetical protein
MAYISTQEADQYHEANRRARAREALELEYLQLCESLEREATQQGFERFYRDPALQRQMRETVAQLGQQTSG